VNFLKALLNLFLGSGPIAIPENAVLVDVRSPEELSSSSIAGAVNIPLADIAVLSDALLPEKNRPIVVFCASGMRSAAARTKLLSLGYENVTNGGGIRTMTLKIKK